MLHLTRWSCITVMAVSLPNFLPLTAVILQWLTFCTPIPRAKGSSSFLPKLHTPMDRLFDIENYQKSHAISPHFQQAYSTKTLSADSYLLSRLISFFVISSIREISKLSLMSAAFTCHPILLALVRCMNSS